MLFRFAIMMLVISSAFVGGQAIVYGAVYGDTRVLLIGIALAVLTLTCEVLARLQGKL